MGGARSTIDCACDSRADERFGTVMRPYEVRDGDPIVSLGSGMSSWMARRRVSRQTVMPFKGALGVRSPCVGGGPRAVAARATALRP